MPSPFPGMDPYLEDPAIWSDFHGTFSMSLRGELNKSLPEHYVARFDRYVRIDEPALEKPYPLGRPDVFVSDQLNRPSQEESTTFLATAPATILLPTVEAKGKPFLKIIDIHCHRVVTVVELLNYPNKSSRKDNEAYLTKRQEYFKGGVNLVEVDFLRSGSQTPVEGKLPKADYYIIISRAIDYPNAGVWPLTIRDPLPTIPITLNPQINPVQLALRPCLDRTYDEGRFSADIDYHRPLNLRCRNKIPNG